MTATIDTTSTDTATQSPVLGELEHVDPNTLEIAANVRTEAMVTPEFVATIAANGVIQPISAVRRADGTLAVRDGQRRTLAGRAAGLATIPVYITPDTEGAEKVRELERITHQFIANENRQALGGKERAEAMAHMLDLGLSASKVAKALHVDRKQVAAATVTVKSETATAAYDSGALTLEQAAVLAEFDSDADAVDALLHAAPRGGFDHQVQRLRDRREAHARRTEAGAEYVAQGYTLLLERPSWSHQATIRLDMLLDSDNREPTPEQIAATDPRLVGVYLSEDEQVIDPDTGEEVDADTVDWDTDDDPELEPSDGLRHANTVTRVAVWSPEWFCTDAGKLGLHHRHQRPTNTTGSAEAGESAEAAALREAEATERDRAARRQVLALNKLGVAAQSVRRAWVREYLSRKTPPKQAATFIATALVSDLFLLTQNKAKDTAAELLGPPTATGAAAAVRTALRRPAISG